jgi:hypothetical protein
MVKRVSDRLPGTVTYKVALQVLSTTANQNPDAQKVEQPGIVCRPSQLEYRMQQSVVTTFYIIPFFLFPFQSL